MLQTTLLSLAVFALGAWVVQRSGHFNPLTVFGSASLLAGLAARWAWWGLGPGLATAPTRLVWDGQQWRIDGEPVALSLQVDFGAAMLFRLEQPAAGGARRHWLMPTRSEAGAAWHPLRVAAHARAPAAAR